MNLWHRFLTAIQFLTRIPVPSPPYTETALAEAMVWFPLVGAALGAAAALVHNLLAPHLGRTVAAFAAVSTLILLTGALHEDGLADCADAFGSHYSRARTLEILRDSRIGTFGGLALIGSVAARVALIAQLPLAEVGLSLVVAGTLSRWSALLLALLPPARRDVPGQGVRLARQGNAVSLIIGSLGAGLLPALLLHWRAAGPLLAAAAVSALTGWFYRRRLAGTTGDCFGATSQLVEVATLTVLAWNVGARVSW